MSMIIRRSNQLSADAVRELIAAGSGERIALLPVKATRPQVTETLVALANNNGGTLLLGLSAKGVASRELAGDAALQAEPPLLLPRPQLVELESGPAVVVQVPAGLPHVYSVKGTYLTRTGAHNRPLTTPELRRLLLDRNESGFESQPVVEATVADFDPLRVNRYLDLLGMAPDEDPVAVLQSRGGVTRVGSGAQCPTVAGLLLFGREPQRFLRSAEITCVRYAGPTMGDEFVRQDLGGTLPEQLRLAEAFVSTNMRRGMRIRGLERVDSTEYPPAVVREAIVNAIAHRDYSVRGDGIRLLMFSDRMEIYSPGRLPGHVTLANLKDERYSRNEAIVAVLGDMGFIERLGYGIDRMIAAMQEAGLPAPVFEETAAGFRVTLQSAGSDLVAGQNQQGRWGHDFLNERQEMAMAYVRTNGRITNSDFQALQPEVSPETIRRDLADLVEKTLLLRIGTKRATYYILK
jgi:ATP-dependent DNA helicase RecG